MMRGFRTREFYIPRGAVAVRDKQSSAVAYIYETNGTPYAAAFAGKGAKPVWHYRFKDAAAREKRIRALFEHYRTLEAAKAQKQAERRAWRHSYTVGDVFKASWGYDQTNIDYYEVVGLIGTTMLEVRELMQGREETLWAQGKCVPLPGQYRGASFRVRAQDGYFKVGHHHARFQQPKIIGGVKTYEASHWTAYA